MAYIYSKHAIRLDPSNIKAYFRAAKASYALKKVAQCVEFCELGLKKEADNAALQSILTTARVALDKQRRAADEARQRAEAKAQAAAERSAALFAMLAQHGAKLGAPRQANLPLKDAFRHVAAAGEVCCRVQILYEEHSQTDTIDAMPLSSTFREQLAVMLPPAAPPAPWDPQARYALPNIELYCVESESRPLKFDVAKRRAEAQAKTGEPAWAKVELDSTLAQLLRRDKYVIPGLVQVHAVVRGSDHAKSMLALDPETFDT